MKNIKLNVPLITQTNDYDCSIASLKMLLKYYGKDIEYGDLKNRLSKYVNREERHIEASAILLSELGFQVYFVNYNKTVLGDDLRNLTEKDLSTFRAALDDSKDSINEFKKTKIKLAIDFIEKGGHILTSPPNLDLLIGFLEKENPVILCVKLSILRGKTEITGNHYVVLTGIENNKFLINDPSPNFSKPYSIDREIIEEAWNKTGSYALWVEN